MNVSLPYHNVHAQKQILNKLFENIKIQSFQSPNR